MMLVPKWLLVTIAFVMLIIGDQSIDFDNILAENKDVLKRLKQADDEQE